MSLDLGELHATISGDNTRLRRAISDSRRRMENLDRFAGRLNIGSVFGIAASSALHFGAALAPAAGALAALPAVGAAGAVAVGALSLALSGVSDVIGAGLTGDVEEFNEALAELPPSAAAVASDVVAAFEGLQEGVQEAFFAPLVAETDTLADTLAGPLRSGLSDVGGSLGGLAAQVAMFVQRAETIDTLEALFDGVSDALDNAASGVQPLLQGVTDLVAVFIPNFGAVGTSIGDAMTRWGEWMSQIASSGQAMTWFTNAKTALGEVWAIGGNVVSIFTGIFNAADGSSVLGTLESITAELDAWVNSVEGQEQLTAVLGLIGDVAGNLAAILSITGGAFATVAGWITSLPGPVQALVTGILAVSLAWRLLGVSALVNGARVAAAWLMQTNAAGVSRAAQIGALVATGARWVWAGAVAMANGIRMAAAWLIGMGPVGWIIAAVIAAVALIIYYWDEIVAGLEAAWTWVSEMAVTIWNGILAFFEEWGPLIFAILTGGVSLLVGWIIDNWDTIWQTTVDIFTAIGDFFVMIWEWIVDTVDAGVTGVLDFFAYLGELPGMAWDWFMGVLDAALSAGADLLSWAGSLPGQILSALGNLASYLWDAGVDLLTGLWDGMISMADSIMDWIWGLLEDMGGAVLDFFGIASPSRLMMGYGEYIGEGLALGIRRSITGVTASAQLMATAAVPSTTTPATPPQQSAVATLSRETEQLLVDAIQAAKQVVVNNHGRDRLTPGELRGTLAMAGV